MVVLLSPDMNIYRNGHFHSLFCHLRKQIIGQLDQFYVKKIIPLIRIRTFRDHRTPFPLFHVQNIVAGLYKNQATLVKDQGSLSCITKQCLISLAQ